MLVQETRKVVYGSKTQGKEAVTVEGKLWNISRDCNAEVGLESLAEGVEDGRLGDWKFVRRAIRQGLRIQCRDRILAENGIIAPKAADKRQLEQAIMVWTTINDIDAWVQLVQKGQIALNAYYEQVIRDTTEASDEPLTPDNVGMVLSSIRAN